MKFLVYGHKGWIGSMICSKIEGDHEIIKTDTRVDNVEDVKKDLNTHKPDRVMCFIGRTYGGNINNIDYLEDHLYENVRDNIFSPVILALECQKRNIHLTYLGTGCIFSYQNDKKIFKEEDNPNFFGSAYSIVKGFTDRIMKELEETVLNLRIRMPITSDFHKRNFITKIISYKNICSIPNSMTVLDDFISIIIDMSVKKYTGTFNICNKGTISHNEILNMYKEHINQNHTWNNITQEEQRQLLKSERSNNELDTSKLGQLYEIPDIHTSVKNIIIKMKLQFYNFVI